MDKIAIIFVFAFIISLLLTSCGMDMEENIVNGSTEVYVNSEEEINEEDITRKDNWLVKLAERKEINEDIIGTIRIPDTQLDLLLAFKEGKEEYYLNRNIYEEYSVAGIPFVQQGFKLTNGGNTIIYGHYYKDGSNFGCLHYYMDYESYYEDHPYIYINSEDGEYKYKIVMVSLMPIQDEDGFVYNDSDYAIFDSEEEFDKFTEHFRSHNKCETGESVEYGDRLLLLSTCYSYDMTDTNRVVSLAKLCENNKV